ncbi:MAG: hypothetical protein KatS3mg108_2025 [Isosphaeraceae bacterium]|jgi:glycosyltransferase involved in cell wall biosynthesis|nr:MAG: hypothetical protein KatS3mg108_2025 [Isosphaeraceae bacterium]
MNHLLILSYHFCPSAAVAVQRLLGFTRHLPDLGWDCAVVAAPGFPWESRDEASLNRLHPTTVVRHVPYSTSRLTLPARKFAPYLCWLPAAARASRRQIQGRRPDVLLTSGPPHWIHLLGLSLQRRFGIPWVADFRDPWIATDWTHTHWGLSRWFQGTLERRLMRRANALIANTPNVAAALRAAFPAAASRIVSITNGYDPEDFGQPLPVDPPAPDQPISILHPGQIYAGRDPRPLLQAVADLHQADHAGDRFHLRFLGHRPDHHDALDLAAEIRRLGLEQVVAWEPPVPHTQAVASIRRAEILLLLDSPGRRLGVPAKLFEFLAAGRPILALTETGSDTHQILASSQTVFRQAPPCDLPAIRLALQELAQLARRARAKPLPDLPRIDQSPYTRANTARQLAQLLDTLRRHRPAVC